MDITEYRNKIKKTKDFILDKVNLNPEIGIILGTGLGGLVDEIAIDTELSYSDIPNFPVSTVESHAGKLIFGEIADKKVIVMQGRFHYYEGYSMQEITFPIRIMKELGVNTLLISNASGGMNPQFSRGDLMILDDHINLLGSNPLIGPNLDEYGPRFPDMSEPYSKRLIAIAEKVALENQLKVQKGTFVSVPGPNLETKAEYRFLRSCGADSVGMSTVPEDIVAVHCGIEVFGVSVITDECFPDALKQTNVDEIIEVANKAEPKLTLLMQKIIAEL